MEGRAWLREIVVDGGRSWIDEDGGGRRTKVEMRRAAKKRSVQSLSTNDGNDMIICIE